MTIKKETTDLSSLIVDDIHRVKFFETFSTKTDPLVLGEKIQDALKGNILKLLVNINFFSHQLFETF